MKVSAGVASLMRAFDQPPAPAPAPRAAAVPKRVVIDTRKELTALLARVAASDPSLVTLDLSGNRQFSSLAPAIKNQALVRMALGDAVQTILLHAVDLSNVNAPAVAQWPGGFDPRHSGKCVYKKLILFSPVGEM